MASGSLKEARFIFGMAGVSRPISLAKAPHSTSLQIG